ncbi:MAG: FtsX-like permease family protein [Erysipelotrichales bacterium]
MVSLKIALRFLLSNKTQMVLILSGIAIGVAIQIFIGSLIFGLQDSLLEKTVGSSAHITIRNKERNSYIDDYQKINLNDSEIIVKSNTLDSNLFVEHKDNNEPVLLRGSNFKDADKIYKYKDNLIKGRMPKENNEIIMGKTLFDDLNLKLNDKINMYAPTGESYDFRVSGVFDLKVEAINQLWAVGNLSYIQDVMDKKDNLTSIEMQVKDVFNADVVASKIKTKYKVVNWKDQNQQLLSGLSGQNISSYMIQFFVIISVTLGISSVLIISVVQKRREIGILKAMGIRNKTSSLIFIFQGLIYGILGGLLGVGLGIGLLYGFSVYVINPDGTPIVPITIDVRFIIFSFVIALLAALISSIIPSLKSSKLDPVEVINNG